MYKGESKTIVLIGSFRSYLQNMGYSKSTCYMLPDCMKGFFEYSKKEVGQITPKEIQDFYHYLQTRPHKLKSGALSEQYINHHIYALRTFFNWLEETGQVQYNPISVLKFKSPEPNHRQPLTQSEIIQLFASCTSQKETALLHLFYSCGLRRSEAVTLNTNDIHFKQQVLYVREGKGAKRRAVPMTQKVGKELESYYLEERINQTKVRDTEAFILDTTGVRISGDSCNRLLKKILERLEIKKEITLHHLRHSIATHLLESGLSIESVRDFLGHGHLETTQIYAKVSQKQLQKL